MPGDTIVMSNASINPAPLVANITDPAERPKLVRTPFPLLM